MNQRFVVFSILLIFNLAFALDNGLGLTPPMGWNTWNHFACNISEDVIIQTADAMISTGLRDKGYIYINLDDCWQVSRDEFTKKIQPDPVKFPHGIDYLANYMHERGLKLGIYSDAGKYTCQKRPGSLGYEYIDAETYADWGIDYLKYDNCHHEMKKPQPRYKTMRDALNKTGKPIYFSMCEWGEWFPWRWAQSVANSWRIALDIKDFWISFMAILEVDSYLSKYAGPGGWNDPDMLEVGNGRMSDNEYQAHFALWALLKAPMLIGNDITDMTQATMNILGNEEVIAVNQDPLGKQGKRYKNNWFTGAQVWAAPMFNGDVAVILFNKSKSTRTITFKFTDVEFNHSQATVRDLINKRDLGVFNTEFTGKVSGHSVIMIRLSPYQQQF